MLPIPPLPGADKYKNVAAALPNGWSNWPANMAAYLQGPTGRPLVTVAQQIWNQAHTADPLSWLDVPAYGSERWRTWFDFNGRAASIGVPLPFPNFPDADTYWPGYRPGATAAEVAPGEVPFNQCDAYHRDGAMAVADFNAKYSALGENDYLPGTRLRKWEGRDNTKLDTRNAAIAAGCPNPPFPEVAGQGVKPAGDIAPPATATTGEPNGNPNLTPKYADDVPPGGTGGPTPWTDGEPVPGTTPVGSSALNPPPATIPGASGTVPGGGPGGMPVGGGPVTTDQIPNGPLNVTTPPPAKKWPTWAPWAAGLAALLVIFRRRSS